MSHKMPIFLKQESTFHPLPTAAILEIGNRGDLPPHTTYDNEISSISSHGIDVSMNSFHNEIDFSGKFL
jgi:hypothetical protein